MIIKTKEEILKSKGITRSSKHHSYEYLYNSILESMETYLNQKRR